MIRLKNLLKEDDDLNNNGYPDASEKPIGGSHWSGPPREPHQSLAQKGELTGLDPEMDSAHLTSSIQLLKRSYERIKPKRVDITNFERDVRDLFEFFKSEQAKGTPTDMISKFFEMYPYVKTYSSWKGTLTDLTSRLHNIWRLAKAIAAGDTSNFGYRVHKWRRDNPHKMNPQMQSDSYKGRKPKSWNTIFAMHVIKAFKNGEFDINNKSSIQQWDTDYNGGNTPNPAFETEAIVRYFLETGKGPDGQS